MEGKVKWFKNDKGYGFITGEDGKDYFMHYTALEGVVSQDDRENLQDKKVTFSLKDTDRGPQAIDVKFDSSSEE